MKKTTVLVVTWIFFIVLLPSTIIVHGETSVDCGFLLALLNLELNYAVNYNATSGIALAQVALNIDLPSGVISIHKQVYRAFLDYFNVLETVKTSEYANTSTLLMLRALIKAREVFTTTLNTYVNYLASCTVNRDTASKLKSNALHLINLLVNTIYPNLVQSVLYTLRGPEVISVELPKSVFEPGENIVINITPLLDELYILRVEVAHWPTLRKLAQLNNYTRVNNSYLVTYRAPYLNEVKDLLFENSVQLALVVTCVLNNITLSYAKPFETVYGYPNVTIWARSGIDYGDELSLSIASSEAYNVTVLVNNVKVLNATLAPGISVYSIPFNATLFKIGYNSLKVVIDETPRTLKYTVEKSFLVEARTPRIAIQAPMITVSWGGNVPVTILNYDAGQVNVVVFVNGEEVLNTTLKDHVYSFNVVSTTLFFSTLNMEVYVVNEHGVRLLVSGREVLCVNSLSTITLIVTAMLLVGVVKRELLLIPSHGLSLKKPLMSHRISALSPLLKPRVVYSVKSRVVGIYYSLLSKLRLPQPSFHETLREHYGKLRLKSNLAKVLWRLLVLAERDLYSNKKPSCDEAVEVAREAEKIAEK